MNTRDSSRLAEARLWHIEGRHADAKPVYRRLLRKYPANSDVQSLMAALLLDIGKASDALPFLKRLTLQRPDDADIHYNHGLALAESSDHLAAIAAYSRALQLSPGHALAWYNTGLSWRRLGESGKAIHALLQDYALRPSSDTSRLLSRLFEEKGDHGQAIWYANRCVERNGANPTDLNWLISLEARSLAESMFIDDARALEIETLAVHATHLQPDNVEALVNLGMVYSQLGDYAGGIPPLKQAYALDASHEGCRELLSVMLMTTGELEEGWRLRTRKERVNNALNASKLPRWQGRVRAGLRLVVLWEQGIGDQILYSRMLTDLLDAGMEVTFPCDPRLIPLFRRSEPRLNVTELLTAEQFREHDAYVGLGELHIWLRPDLQELPTPKIFLEADGDRRGEFRKAWETRYPGRRFIGLSWQSHSALNGASKSIPLAILEPILRTPGAVFICTQYGAGSSELLDYANRHGIDVHVDEACNALSDMDLAAAQLAALDEFVSVSNASVHLAGALGVRTHVLVGRRPIWHWFVSGASSPWYKDVSLYRQIHLDSWAEPILALASQLHGRP